MAVSECSKLPHTPSRASPTCWTLQHGPSQALQTDRRSRPGVFVYPLPGLRPMSDDPAQPPEIAGEGPPATEPQPAATQAQPAHARIICADNLDAMAGMPDGHFSLIYIDPPFNTGKQQSHTPTQMVRDTEGGDRTGFGGHRYRTSRGETLRYQDRFSDYPAFLAPRLHEAQRLLDATGSLFVHLDYREVHYIKVLLDSIFGRECFMNEIIWAYDYGGRAKRKWSAKHDSILWYVRDPNRYCFNYAAMDRIPYMAPGLVGPEKAARGKTPTDVWWHTIVAPRAHERTGYPTQKPLGVLERIVNVHSQPGDRLLDFFAGSGSFGEAALKAGRNVTLVDHNTDAVAIMHRRLRSYDPGLDDSTPKPGLD